MRTRPDPPALAIGRQLWIQYRQGALVALATLIGTAAVAPWVFAWLPPRNAVTGSLLPMLGIFGYFMNALLFAEETGNLASGYPRRMYVLPVPTRTLVVWPMLYGAGVVGLLWLATAGLIYRPAGFQTPLLLPALALMTAMAWLQATTWAPLNPGWLRVVAGALALGVLGGIAWGLLLLRSVPHGWIAAYLAAYLAAALASAIPVALAGVAVDRCGGSWRLWSERYRLAWWRSSANRRPFRSSAEAQRWYEWRCHGLGLPIAVGGVSLLALIVVLAANRNASRGGGLSLGLVMLLLPLLVANSVGPALGRMCPIWIKQRGVITFVGIRPMSSGNLVAAKYGMASRSVLVSIAISLVAAAIMFVVDPRGGGMAAQWHLFQRTFPGWRSPAVIALVAVIGPVLVWRQVTDIIPIAITGRAWIENLAAFPMVILLLVGVFGTFWFQSHPEYRPLLFAALPWLVALILTLKAGLAAVSFRVALRRGVINPLETRRVLILWAGLTALATSLTALVMPLGLDRSVQVSMLAGSAALAPLARFALAPLALDWNRHR